MGYPASFNSVEENEGTRVCSAEGPLLPLEVIENRKFRGAACCGMIQ